MDHVLKLVWRHAGQLLQLARRDHDRWLRDDPVVAVDMLRELRECLQAVARAGLQDVLLGSLLGLLCRLPLRLVRLHTHRGAHGRHQVFLGHVGVPDVHGAHLREPGHRLSVCPYRGERHIVRLGLREAIVACRDREARGHAFDVVLERARQRLVEVVQIEKQGSFRRCEHAEVRQVGIAAELRDEAGPRRVFQVGGHDLGRASVEREGRDQHAPVAHRHQVRLAGRVLFFEQCDGIGAVGSRGPTRVAGRGYFLPRCLAVLLPFIDAWVLDLGHAHDSHDPLFKRASSCRSTPAGRHLIHVG